MLNIDKNELEHINEKWRAITPAVGGRSKSRGASEDSRDVKKWFTFSNPFKKS